MPDNLLPFFLPACGLLSLITGAFLLLVLVVTSRAVSGPGAKEKISESAEDVLAKLRTKSHAGEFVARAGGIFWFVLGSATLWFSDFRAPWILPSVGLFWMVIGVWTFLASFLPGRQAASEAAMSSALALASNPDALRRLRRQQWATGLLLICMGFPVLWFSGIRVGAVPVALPRPAEEGSQLTKIVMRQVEQEFAQHGHVGLVVGAIADGEELLMGFGRRQLGDSRPPDADTLFEIGSITKTFTGILLAQRLESGEWELDDRVAEFLPEGWSLSESARAVTLRHCTTHASGFPRLPANLLGPSNVFRPLFGGDPYRDYSEQQFREAIANVELEFTPGSESRYSNFGVGLLGFILATQSGTDYETLVTQEICRPLGMHDTVITGDRWRLDNLSAKYHATLRLGPAMMALESAEWRIPNHLAGAGAVRSTGRDMMTYLKANMGLVTTPLDDAIERSHQELFQEHRSQAIGMNWIRSFDRNMRQNIIWHNGGTGGFRTYLGFTEDRKVGVFLMANTTISVDSMAKEILQALTP